MNFGQSPKIRNKRTNLIRETEYCGAYFFLNDEIFVFCLGVFEQKWVKIP